MSIEREIIERLNESRRLDEAFPPVLNKLPKYDKDRVRAALTKAGIDIENTPYESTSISNGRDPRLQGPDVIIFEFGDSKYQGPAVWLRGSFIVDTYLYKAEKNVSKMSWKNILEYTTRTIVMKFDKDNAEALSQKKNDRSNIRKSMEKSGNIRYAKGKHPRYATLDKSGYVVDPNKYKKMLADMKLNDAPKILQSAKDIYAKLANNLDKIDWDNDNDYYNYDTIMKLIVRAFQDLTKSLAKYEKYKKDNPNIDSSDVDNWWYDSLKNDVSRNIQELREIMIKAKKYL